MPQYRNGQRVLYKPVGVSESRSSENVGTVRTVLTEPGSQANRKVEASEHQPKYEIENENTSKMTTVYEKNVLGPA